MTQQTQLDEAKLEAFMGKVIGDLGGTMAFLMSHMGDRLGLFKELDANGPATSQELADRANINERYAREWLGGLASAGYLEYEPATQRFTLPAEHAPALAHESGPMFVGSIFGIIPHMIEPMDQLIEAFKNGGGVSQGEYSSGMFRGIERLSAGWFENHLVQEWIPATSDIGPKLEQGVAVADLGCGSGQAVIKLAEAFPNSTFIGYDIHAPSLERAANNAADASVSDRVEFKQADASGGLPAQYDVITTFDVIHDSADPRGLFKTIREGLKPDGTYLLVDINCSDKVEENAGPLGTAFYGFSLAYCMTVSLAEGGEGLGTVGLPPSKVRELGAEAGFTTINQLEIENPFNNIYELKV